MTWAVERRSLPPSAFHALALPEPVGRAVWVCDATAPALVLGSTQPDAVVDRAACQRAGVEVVRRRSGGGAVLVVPGDLLWVDLLVPRADPLWHDDVGTAFHWVGDLFAAVLADHGQPAVVHRGGLVEGGWGREVCFAGLGPGEVTVGDAPARGPASSARCSAGGTPTPCWACCACRRRPGPTWPTWPPACRRRPTRSWPPCWTASHDGAASAGGRHGPVGCTHATAPYGGNWLTTPT